ncbi:hypothetical protein PsYK624_107500 [Phanerochaete sordida]|uniref:Uncharacterized protein n=1 Tax=Phanerochaete sordida TaxID=48140 RepID=A0A9P3GGL2_9APHY|nr:hypothetical protein PsYK624_107500 [Phanerochaete sordida]
MHASGRKRTSTPHGAISQELWSAEAAFGAVCSGPWRKVRGWLGSTANVRWLHGILPSLGGRDRSDAVRLATLNALTHTTLSFLEWPIFASQMTVLSRPRERRVQDRHERSRAHSSPLVRSAQLKLILAVRERERTEKSSLSLRLVQCGRSPSICHPTGRMRQKRTLLHWSLYTARGLVCLHALHSPRLGRDRAGAFAGCPVGPRHMRLTNVPASARCAPRAGKPAGCGPRAGAVRC